MSNRPEDSYPAPAVPGGWRSVSEAASTPKEAEELTAPATVLPTHTEPEEPGGWYVPSYAQARVAALNATAASTNLTASPTAETMPDGEGEAKEPALGIGEPAPVPAPMQAAPPVAESKEESPTIGEPAPIPLATGAAPATGEVEPKEESPTIGEPAPIPAIAGAAESSPPSEPAKAEGAPKAELPSGAALSTEIDYSNYVPGVGFVAKAADAAPAEPAPQPGEPHPIPALAGEEPQAEVSGYTPLAIEADPSLAPQVAPPTTGGTGPLSTTGPMVSAALAEPVANPALTQRFYDVERSVQALRRKYTAGLITRDELQAELRKLMILDEEGHWWMIGLESDKWYKYDGKDWVQLTPPGLTPEPGAVPAVPSGTSKLAAPAIGGISQPVKSVAETGVSQPVGAQDTNAEPFGPKQFDIPLDEYGMPLPQKVPVDDLGATIVGAAAPKLDNTLRTPATQTRNRAVDATAASGVAPYDGGVTAPSNVVQVTQPGLAVQQAAGVVPSPVGGPTPYGQQAEVSPRLQPGWQPDYGPRPKSIVADRHRLAGLLIRLAIVGVFLALLFGVVAVGGAVYYYYSIINQYDAKISAIAQSVQSTSQSAQILDANGKVLFTANDPNLGARIPVTLDRINPYMIFAVVSTENERFYEDPGFDPIAIFRAILQNLGAGQGVSGASTITQQLARQRVLDPGAAADRSSSRKITEIIVSSEIARRYTKNQILEYYLNTVYFGNLAYGAEAAAKTYFNKSAKDLNIAEGAFLAGLIQSPVTYDPMIKDPNDKTHGREAALKRMEIVLGLMLKKGCVQMQHKPYDTAPFCVTQADMSQAVVPIAQVKGTTFKAPTNTTPAPHFINYVLQQLEDLGFGQGVIYTQGFKVYTTLDSNVQAIAQQAVKDQITKLKNTNRVGNGAVFAIRPSDGAIIAMVGSVDFNDDANGGQVNVVLAARQPGSSIKPFVYVTAFERDDKGQYWTPATVIWDLQQCFGTQANPYCPTNYDNRFHGPQSVRYALANSYNIPAVKTFAFIGLDRFVNTATRFQINFPLSKPQDAGYATALGAVEVSLYDMVRGYSVFANGGNLVQPYAIAKISRTVNGKEEVVYEAKDHPMTKVAEAAPAYLITSILSDNNARLPAFGRGNPLQTCDGRPAAVKTGTTNNYKDNLTIGYTPQLVVGVWVGNTDGTPMAAGTSGITGAAPIWNTVMCNALKGQPVMQFKAPADIQQVSICTDFGTLFDTLCRNPRADDVAWTVNPPPPMSSVLQTLTIDSFSGLKQNQFCPDYPIQKTFLVVNDPVALNWINTTPDGAKWAQDRGITLPLVPPPTAECDANTPRPQIAITSPTSQQQVQGLVEIRGSVFVPNFNRYQLELGTGFTPTQFGIVYGPVTAQQSNPNSLLGAWDTSRLPNGAYTLRLFAVDNDGHFVTTTVPVIVNNVVAQPTAIPQPGEQPTAIPQPGVEPTMTPIVIQPQPVQPDSGQPTMTPTISVFPPAQ